MLRTDHERVWDDLTERDDTATTRYATVTRRPAAAAAERSWIQLLKAVTELNRDLVSWQRARQ